MTGYVFPFDGAERDDWGGGAGALEPADYCSREGAMALKARIEAYWRERGQDVMIALHNVGFHPAIRAARFDVRSDMLNGMPRAVAKLRGSPGAAADLSAEAAEAEADLVE